MSILLDLQITNPKFKEDLEVLKGLVKARAIHSSDTISFHYTGL